HLAEAKGISPSAIEQLRTERNMLYSTLLSQRPLIMDGVQEVIQVLHRIYVMGIVTSSRQDHFMLIHHTTDLLQYFQFVLTASCYMQSKPHPEPYLLAAERSGCRKEECLIIEDSERGLKAAMEARIRCIVVPTEFTRESNFAGAYKVLENLTELLSEPLLSR